MYEEHVVTLIRQALRGYGVDGAHVEIGEEGRTTTSSSPGWRQRSPGRWGARNRSGLPSRSWTARPHPLPTPAEPALRARRRARLLAFADSFGPDCLLLDLEDAVALPEKDSARFLVRRVLATMDFGRTELWVRINPSTQGSG